MEYSSYTIEPESTPQPVVGGEPSHPVRALVGADPFLGLDTSSPSSQQLLYPSNEAHATASQHFFYPADETKPAGLLDKQVSMANSDRSSKELDPSLTNNNTSELLLQGFQSMQSALTQMATDIKNLVVHPFKGKQHTSQQVSENTQQLESTIQDHKPVMVRPPPISHLPNLQSYGMNGSDHKPVMVQPPPISRPPTARDEVAGEEPASSKHLHTTVDFNRVSCPTPPLNLKDIHQSIRDFESFCKMSEVPIAHQRRLLLEQLKQKAPHVLTEFVRAHEADPSYEVLKSFLLSRFESVAAIHHLALDPPFMNADAYSQFSKAVDLYKKTSPEEFVKFVVLRTSPPELQKAMANSLNLPYDRFFTKYKNKLEASQAHTSPLGRKQVHDQPHSRSQPFTSQRKGAPLTSNNMNHQQTSSKGYTLCEYHFQYGHRARNCNIPECSMKHLVPAAVQAFRQHPKNAPGQ